MVPNKGTIHIAIGFAGMLLIAVFVYLAISAAAPAQAHQFILDPLAQLRTTVTGIS